MYDRGFDLCWFVGFQNCRVAANGMGWQFLVRPATPPGVQYNWSCEYGFASDRTRDTTFRKTPSPPRHPSMENATLTNEDSLIRMIHAMRCDTRMPVLPFSRAMFGNNIIPAGFVKTDMRPQHYAFVIPRALLNDGPTYVADMLTNDQGNERRLMLCVFLEVWAIVRDVLEALGRIDTMLCAIEEVYDDTQRKPDIEEICIHIFVNATPEDLARIVELALSVYLGRCVLPQKLCRILTVTNKINAEILARKMQSLDDSDGDVDEDVEHDEEDPSARGKRSHKPDKEARKKRLLYDATDVMLTKIHNKTMSMTQRYALGYTDFENMDGKRLKQLLTTIAQPSFVHTGIALLFLGVFDFEHQRTSVTKLPANDPRYAKFRNPRAYVTREAQSSELVRVAFPYPQLVYTIAVSDLDPCLAVSRLPSSQIEELSQVFRSGSEELARATYGSKIPTTIGTNESAQRFANIVGKYSATARDDLLRAHGVVHVGGDDQRSESEYDPGDVDNAQEHHGANDNDVGSDLDVENPLPHQQLFASSAPQAPPAPSPRPVVPVVRSGSQLPGPFIGSFSTVYRSRSVVYDRFTTADAQRSMSRSTARSASVMRRTPSESPMSRYNSPSPQFRSQSSAFRSPVPSSPSASPASSSRSSASQSSRLPEPANRPEVLAELDSRTLEEDQREENELGMRMIDMEDLRISEPQDSFAQQRDAVLLECEKRRCNGPARKIRLDLFNSTSIDAIERRFSDTALVRCIVRYYNPLRAIDLELLKSAQTYYSELWRRNARPSNIAQRESLHNEMLTLYIKSLTSENAAATWFTQQILTNTMPLDAVTTAIVKFFNESIVPLPEGVKTIQLVSPTESAYPTSIMHCFVTSFSNLVKQSCDFHHRPVILLMYISSLMASYDFLSPNVPNELAVGPGAGGKSTILQFVQNMLAHGVVRKSDFATVKADVQNSDEPVGVEVRNEFYTANTKEHGAEEQQQSRMKEAMTSGVIGVKRSKVSQPDKSAPAQHEVERTIVWQHLVRLMCANYVRHDVDRAFMSRLYLTFVYYSVQPPGRMLATRLPSETGGFYEEMQRLTTLESLLSFMISANMIPQPFDMLAESILNQVFAALSDNLINLDTRQKRTFARTAKYNCIRRTLITHLQPGGLLSGLTGMQLFRTMPILRNYLIINVEDIVTAIRMRFGFVCDEAELKLVKTIVSMLPLLKQHFPLRYAEQNASRSVPQRMNSNVVRPVDGLLPLPPIEHRPAFNVGMRGEPMPDEDSNHANRQRHPTNSTDAGRVVVQPRVTPVVDARNRLIIDAICNVEAERIAKTISEEEFLFSNSHDCYIVKKNMNEFTKALVDSVMEPPFSMKLDAPTVTTLITLLMQKTVHKTAGQPVHLIRVIPCEEIDPQKKHGVYIGIHPQIAVLLRVHAVVDDAIGKHVNTMHCLPRHVFGGESLLKMVVTPMVDDNGNRVCDTNGNPMNTFAHSPEASFEASTYEIKRIEGQCSQFHIGTRELDASERQSLRSYVGDPAFPETLRNKDKAQVSTDVEEFATLILASRRGIPHELTNPVIVITDREKTGLDSNCSAVLTLDEAINLYKQRLLAVNPTKENRDMGLNYVAPCVPCLGDIVHADKLWRHGSLDAPNDHSAPHLDGMKRFWNKHVAADTYKFE